MSNILARFIKGITLPSQSSDPAEVEEGSLYSVSNPSPRIKAYIQSATREVITNTQSQTLQNKLIIASENTIQVAATGVTATELNSALQEIQSNFSGKANTNLDNIVTTSIPAGVNLESNTIGTSSTFRIKTKNQTTTSSGSVDLATGNSDSSFNSGNLNVYTGDKTSDVSGRTGSIAIGSGTASGVDRATSSVSSGVLNMTTGGVSASNSGSGSILLKSGLVNNSDNNSGAVTIGTGNVSNSTGVSGNLTLETGTAIGSVSTTTGNIVLRTGANGDQKSGDITLTTGLAGTDEGTIYLDGKEVNVTSKKITNLADGTASTDAVNLKQLNNLKSSETLFIQTFESVALTDFTQTGLSLSTSSPLHGEISALLTHNASVNQLFKQVIPVDNKFRNQTMVLRLDVKSNASAGNVVINIYDETNAANIVASEQLQLSNDVNGTKNSVGFTIPETCASLSYTITALPEVGSPVTRIDDIICELAETALLETVVELTGNAQTLTIPLTQSGLVQEGDSTIRVYGANGVGSTSVRVLRFATTATNLGSDISYADSAINGASFTVNTSGVYSISGWYVTGQSLSVASIGVSVNATVAEQATSITSLSDNKILTLARDAQNSAATNSKVVEFAWTGYLNVGDILRVQNDGESISNVHCTVSKQSSLKQVSVNPNSKITIPTSELRFEGASTRGSTATAIVKFDTMAKLRGDAFTVESDSVLGTRITMKKAGKLDVQATVTVASSFTFGISKNQTTLTSTSPVSECIAIQTNTTAFNSSVAGSTYVQVGDIIRVSSSGNPSGVNFLTLAFQEQDISVSVTNTLPQFSESDSSVRVDTANGYGSTASNKIRRFSNVRDNIGADIEYLDSAADGARFVVKSAGVYNISYTEQASSAAFFGLSKNSSQLTTAIINITTADRLAIGTTDNVSGYPETIAWQGYLQAGDVVRAHTEGALGSASPERTQFTISKVGKPNVTGVDVTAFVNVPQPTTQSSFITFGSNFSGNFVGALTSSNGSGVYSYSTSTGVYTMLKPGSVTLSAAIRNTAAALVGIRILVDNVQVASDYTPVNGGAEASAGYSTTLQAGQTFKFQSDGTVSLLNTRASVLATAASDQILTAPETFSTDTASLTYANIATYTPSTLANAPVGTYITFTYAGGGNTRSQTTGLNRPTQTDADMNANGILLYTRVFSVGSSSSQPAAIAIQIGKGMKGKTIDLYKSAGKLISGSIDSIHVGTDTQRGLAFQSYDEKTGILYLDAGLNLNGSATTDNKFIFNDNLTQASGYLVINASKNPALTGLNVLLPRIAVLTGINAATPVASTYVTRTLNTLNDPTAIVTSLASNQFTLTAGTYSIMASATHHRTNSASSRIRNITDGTSAISGIASYASSASVTGFVDNLSGIVTINSTKTFELQSIAESSASASYGIAAGSDYVNAQVTIQKIK